MKRRILCLALALVICLGLFPSEAFAATTFKDVNASDWFYDAVQYAYDNGMMSGTGDGRFSPNYTTTRGMLVAVLYRMEGSPSAPEAAFTDVAKGQWYTDAVAWANSNGIVTGYGDGRFGPGDTITREQTALILYRYAKYKNCDTDTSGSLSIFSDANQTSSYAVDAMGWAVGSGLISGTGNATLTPRGSATRAQLAMILMRFCESVIVNPDNYSITSLTVNGSSVTAVVSTGNACTLSVEILSEDGEKTLSTAAVSVSGDLMMEEVVVSLNRTPPKYFLVRAILKTSTGIALSNPYTSRGYTREYQEWMEKGPEDYPAEKALDFGKAGYGVLADGVEKIDGKVTSSSEDTYTVAMSTLPESGDVLMLMDTSTPVKVKLATKNPDGTVTIVADTDVCLSDFYEVLRISTIIDAVAAQDQAQMQSVDYADVMLEWADYREQSVSETWKIGSAKLELEATLGAGIEIDINMFEGVFECLFAVNSSGKIKVIAANELDNDDIGLPDKWPELSVLKEKIPIPHTPLSADLELSVPIEFSLASGGSAFAEVSARCGFSYNKDDGMQTINQVDADTRIDLFGEFEISTGPKISLGVELPYEIVDASVSAQVGLKLHGKASVGMGAGTANSGYHACTSCIDGDLSVFFNGKCKLAYRIIFTDVSDEIELPIFSKERPLFEFYISLVNSEDSIFGGKVTFGKGKCPNVLTTEVDGEEMLKRLQAGDFSSFAGTYTPYYKIYGVTEWLYDDLILNADGGFRCDSIAGVGNTAKPKAVTKNDDGSYTCTIQTFEPFYDEYEGWMAGGALVCLIYPSWVPATTQYDDNQNNFHYKTRFPSNLDIDTVRILFLVYSSGGIGEMMYGSSMPHTHENRPL